MIICPNCQRFIAFSHSERNEFVPFNSWPAICKMAYISSEFLGQKAQNGCVILKLKNFCRE